MPLLDALSGRGFYLSISSENSKKMIIFAETIKPNIGRCYFGSTPSDIFIMKLL